MEIKTKSNLMIVGSLIIGLFIGSIATLTFLHEKRPSVDFRKRGSYSKRMLDIIEPNDSQKIPLESLLKKYEEKMMNQHKEAMKLYRSKADSLKDELSTILTKEQMDKLEAYHKKRKERYKRKRDADKKGQKERVRND